jgi:hypothetical protein
MSEEERAKQDPSKLNGERYITMNDDGTPDSYGLGFQEGCRTATSAIGGGPFRLAGPKFRPDKLVDDSWYARGFQDAMSFCTHRLDWEMH